jgi:hypothetical protein
MQQLSQGCKSIGRLKSWEQWKLLHHALLVAALAGHHCISSPQGLCRFDHQLANVKAVCFRTLATLMHKAEQAKVSNCQAACTAR